MIAEHLARVGSIPAIGVRAMRGNYGWEVVPLAVTLSGGEPTVVQDGEPLARDVSLDRATFLAKFWGVEYARVFLGCSIGESFRLDRDPAADLVETWIRREANGKLPRLPLGAPRSIDFSTATLCWIRGSMYMAWRRDGRLHRDGGPARVGWDGTMEWYRYGRRHRDDGPAVIRADGRQEWWRHGKRHRDDGPAVIHANGREEWWIDGKRVDPLEALARVAGRQRRHD